MSQPDFEKFAVAELLADQNHVIGVVDTSMIVRWISPSAKSYELDAVGRSIADLIHPEDIERVAQAFEVTPEREGYEPSVMSSSIVPLRLITGTGVVAFEATARWIKTENGGSWFVTILRDVSTRNAIDQALRRLVAGSDELESIQAVISAAHEYGGVQGAQMVWQSGRSRKTFGDMGAHLATVDDVWGDLSAVAAPGCPIEMDGSTWGYALPVFSRDEWLGTMAIWGHGAKPDLQLAAAAMTPLLDLAALSLRRAGELAELERRATTDEVTGLLNRHAFFAALDRLINQSAVMYIDLDEFKAVNDRFGHTLGDRLLSVVSRRLTDALGADDVIGRIGGDEFAVLCRSATPSQIRAAGERIVAALNQTFVIDGHRIETGASVGIAYSEATIGGRPLLDHADQALLEAKAQGKGRLVVVATFPTESPSST